MGSGRPLLDEQGNLRVRGTYASTELAQTTRALVTEGHIRTTSVAFLRKQDHKTGTPRRELLNGAFVAVPANPAARVLASKTLTSTASTVQAWHDHATALGATCPGHPATNTDPAGPERALRERLAGIDTTDLPDVVRAVLAALGGTTPDTPPEPAGDPGDAEPSEADAERAALAELAVRATQIRAVYALATTERHP